MLRTALRVPILAAARSATVKAAVTRAPVSGGLVRRFVAGEAVDDAISTARGLHEAGLLVSLDRLGEDVTERDQAVETARAYVDLLGRLGAEGLAGCAEVSLKLSAVGQGLDEALALDGAREVCAAAAAAGTTVTVDMEDHTTTDSTLGIVRELRADFPWLGAVLQAYLRRTEADCKELAGPGSRVRLCKGAYREPESVAFQRGAEVNASYLRCLQVLMAGDGYPMVATHDPRLVRAALDEVAAAGRAAPSYEFQMLYGVRPAEQRRLTVEGQRVRVYVPYGDQWYGYLMRRLAERPANIAFFLRAVATKG